MGNSWFEFKQFRIEQGRSAMKVCTDSCIFGGLIIQTESASENSIQNVLDLGAGTGLLGLMLAQEFPLCKITGIELDSGSSMDCRFNYENAPWTDRMELLEMDFREFEIESRKFDLIVCNPPFFFEHMPSPISGRRQAMHMAAEGLADWLDFMQANLNKNGRIWLLFSPDAWIKAIQQLKRHSLRIVQVIKLFRKPSTLWRIVVCLSAETSSEAVISEIFVLEEGGKPSDFTLELLNQFYLNRSLL